MPFAPCEFCGEANGVRCLKESAARYCPNAPTLKQIAEHERLSENRKYTALSFYGGGPYLGGGLGLVLVILLILLLLGIL
jgi:hypothetical protein